MNFSTKPGLGLSLKMIKAFEAMQSPFTDHFIKKVYVTNTKEKLKTVEIKEKVYLNKN